VVCIQVGVRRSGGKKMGFHKIWCSWEMPTTEFNQCLQLCIKFVIATDVFDKDNERLLDDIPTSPYDTRLVF
jgi:hypothetical protein